MICMKTGWQLLVSFLILTLLVNPTVLVRVSNGESASHNADSMWVEPSTVYYTLSNATLGSRFNVTVWLNITSRNVFAYQVAMHYNRTLLRCTAVGFTAGGTSQFMQGHSVFQPPSAIDGELLGNGSMMAMETCRGTDSIPAPRVGSLIWIEFEIVALPQFTGDPPQGETLTCMLDISSENPGNTRVVDENVEDIPITAYDCAYKIATSPPVHDVAVSNLTTSTSYAISGDIVNVTVTAANYGNVPESFWLAVYADASATVIGDEIVVGNQTLTLPNISNSSLCFLWNTTGTPFGDYTISAEAQTVTGDTNSTNNLLVDGMIQVVQARHDVAVSKVTKSENKVLPGKLVNVTVTAANYGNVPESFWLAVYADVNTTVIGDEIVLANQTLALNPASSTSLWFLWNTTGLAFGDYAVSAEAQTVTGDLNATNNMLVDGTVQIVQPLHEIAVIDIQPSKSIYGVGEMANITVHVRILSNQTETDYVTLYADRDTTTVCDEIVIGQTSVTVDGMSLGTATFMWDTTGLSEGNYVFTAVASPLPGEVDLKDNNLTQGSTTLLNIPVSHFPHPADAMWVEAPLTVLTIDNATINSKFNITIWMNITENVFMYQIYLHYNYTQLQCTRAGFTAGATSEFFSGHRTIPIGPMINPSYLGNGTIMVGESLTGDDHVGSQSGSLIWAEFKVISTPSVRNFTSKFDLTNEYNINTFVFDYPDLNTLVFTPYDGQYEFLSYPHVQDVAVTNIRSSQNAVYAGDQASVEVDVWNKEETFETVSLTLYGDVNTSVIGDEVNVGTMAVNLVPFGTSTSTFLWDTTNVTEGNYTLTACAWPLLGEVCVADNNLSLGSIQIFQVLLPCPDINVTCPANMTLNPSIFTFDPNYHARIVNIGNVSIVSTGFEGGLRVVGSNNGTIRLCVNQPGSDYYNFYMPQYGEVQVSLWLMFQPETHWETYGGTYTLNLTVCGTHRNQLCIRDISIDVCQNGAYIVNSQTATFTWNLTGGSLVYLTAETDLPSGWTYSVDPPIGTFFETPHLVNVNITAPPDAGEGEVGKVTLRAYKNSTGAMIWQFIYFASTENNPPNVENMEMPIMSPDGYLLFNTTVSDHSGIDKVILYSSIDGGPWQNTTMQWTSGDTFNSTTYTCKEYVGTDPASVQYYVSAVDWLGNETDTQTQTISTTSDIAITGFSLDRKVLFEGGNISISAMVANQGTLPISFVNLVLYANSSVVATRTLFNLQNGTFTTLDFSVALPKGVYTMALVATPLPNEITEENNIGSGMVRVSRVGDLTGPTPGVPDGKCDIRDIAVVAKAFGSTPGTPGWNANCDVTGLTPFVPDGKVDIRDISLVAKHFGEAGP
jgi:hypothetical protein